MDEKEVKQEQLTLEGVELKEKGRLYLKLPQGMTKKEFQDTILFFKENGAKYDGGNRQWYIQSENTEKFSPYLPKEVKENQPRPEQGRLPFGKPSPYIGFAYTKGPNPEKAPTMYGESREEILQRVRNLNAQRTPEKAFITCSIGLYHPEAERYQEYFKYDVKTGRNISKIYLQIPNGLNKEEFRETLQYFKENGAQFNPNPKKKGWYIFPDQQEKFADYLPSPEKNAAVEVRKEPVDRKAAELQKDMEEIAKQAEEIRKNSKTPILHHVVDVDTQYTATLKNGEVVSVGEKEIGTRKAVEIVEALEDKIRNHLNLIPHENYDISVSKQPYENRCTIYNKDGEIIEQLNGDQFGVLFPALKAEEVSRIVEEHLKPKTMAVEEHNIVGEKVSVHLPVYNKESRFPELSGIKTVTGTLKEIDAENSVLVLDTDEGIQRIDVTQRYSKGQAAVITKAIDKGMSGNALDLIGDPHLSVGQMQEVYNGVSDGMNVLQVANYANPKYEIWQMDIYRYGMQHGIPFDNITDMMKRVSGENAWENSRRLVDKMIKAQRNVIIKDLKDHNLVPERQLVMKIEALNGATGKFNTVDSILGQRDNALYGTVKKEISSMLQRQKSATMEMPRMSDLIQCR